LLVKKFSFYLPCLLVVAGSFILSACQESVDQRDTSDHDKGLYYLVKSDIDTVADQHMRANLLNLEQLARKLYQRNPVYCKHNGRTIEQCVSYVTSGHPPDWRYPELDHKTSLDALRLTFDEQFHGDRVMAFVVGLTTMIIKSYNGKTEFHMLDELDPQKLYNCARNIEIAVWKLSNDRTSQQQLFLLSNSRPGEPVNLSYERLFGKLISTQDNMANIMAEKTNRRIKNVIQSLATAVFAPI
jgi:hypothetical protein